MSFTLQPDQGYDVDIESTEYLKDRIGNPQPSSISDRDLGSGAVGVSILPHIDRRSAGSPWLYGPAMKPLQHRDMMRVPVKFSQRYTSQW